MNTNPKEFACAMVLLVVTLLLLGTSCVRRGCFPTTAYKRTLIEHKPHGFQ